MSDPRADALRLEQRVHELAERVRLREAKRKLGQIELDEREDEDQR